MYQTVSAMSFYFYLIILLVFLPRCKLANSGPTSMLLNKIHHEIISIIISIKAFINSTVTFFVFRLGLPPNSQPNSEWEKSFILKQQTQKLLSISHGRTDISDAVMSSRPGTPKSGIILRRLRTTPRSAYSAGNIQAASLETI